MFYLASGQTSVWNFQGFFFFFKQKGREIKFNQASTKSQTLCKGPLTYYPTILKEGIPIHKWGSEVLGGPSTCPRSHHGWVVELGFESRPPGLQAHAFHWREYVSTPKCPDMLQHQGGDSFGQDLTSHPSQGTKRSPEPQPRTDHRMLVSKVTLGYLLFSTSRYVCIYAYTNT